MLVPGSPVTGTATARFLAGVVGHFLLQHQSISYFKHGAFCALFGAPTIVPHFNRRSYSMTPIEEVIIESFGKVVRAA
jgi:hypothetical protein